MTLWELFQAKRAGDIAKINGEYGRIQQEHHDRFLGSEMIKNDAQENRRLWASAEQTAMSLFQHIESNTRLKDDLIKRVKAPSHGTVLLSPMPAPISNTAVPVAKQALLSYQKAYETVSLLTTVETEIPQCVQELRTAVETHSGIHDLGKDGKTLLDWLDMEIAAAQRFVADGVSRPNLIDMERLDTAPDTVAQMDLVWMLFDAAAREECLPEQRRALLSTARTVTEMCGMDDLLLATVKPKVAKLAAGLRAELAEVRDSLPGGRELLAGTGRELSPPVEPAM